MSLNITPLAQRVYDDRVKGMTYAAIAAKYGFSTTRAYYLVKNVERIHRRISMPDFKIIYQGSIVILEPQSVKAEEWLAENIDDGIFWGKGLVVDPAELDATLVAVESDGFNVERS